ncbi:MAG: hypothetical protein WCI04_07235, partial [archaeon]
MVSFSFAEQNPLVLKVNAANYKIKTGYFVGNASTLSISGLGFQPQALIIKSTSSAGNAIFKTSSMATTTSSFFAATADNTASLFTLDSDGFTLTNNATI